MTASITRVRRARTATAALAAATLALGLLASPRPAGAAPSACPAALPVAEVTEGLVAEGLTVDAGRTPEPFTATVLGVLDDGIAPDLDLIIAEAGSPAIDRAGGIWAGMSGSPVYAADGRLLGAVAYSLAAGPSPITGITPAADMLVLLEDGTSGTAFRERVSLPAALAGRVAASAEVTTAEAAAGLRQLPLPLNVSGLGRARFDALAGRLAAARGLHARAVQAAGAPASPGDPSEIVAGGNFAAAISAGDVSQVAVGTTTAVCDGTALAFGHPFLLRGAGLPAHDATALYVQPDSLGGPSKVANPGGVVGTVEADRLAGLTARLGPGPTQIDVTSTVTANSATSRTGLTRVATPLHLPSTSALHLLANFDRVAQRIGEGRSALTWTVAGTDSAGAPWQFRRTNRYADPRDIGLASVTELAHQLAAIDGNEFQDVRIGGVTVEAAVADGYRAYRVARLEQQVAGGGWTPVGATRPVRARSGATFGLRVTLRPYRNRGPVVQTVLVVPVPAGQRGGTGSLLVAGGAEAAEGAGPADPTCIIEPEACGTTPTATSFQGLLTGLAGAVHNHDVTATLAVEAATGLVRREVRRSAPQVVTGVLTVPVIVF
jgi:hypothetical protein